MKSLLTSTTKVCCGAVLAAIIIMACSDNNESNGSIGASSSSDALPDIFRKGKHIKTGDEKPNGEIVEVIGAWVKVKTNGGKHLWFNPNSGRMGGSWVEDTE